MTALLLIAVLPSLVESSEVPMHKAMPPKMDPKPTLPEVTHRVFLEIEINGKNVGKIMLGLFGTVAPRTVENFRSLCVCDKGDDKLCYKGSTFHRIIPDFMIQGGDTVHGDGTGGTSIYNDGGTFEDEESKVTFNRKFLLAMANSGPDSNASQFFITTVKTQWLTGKHVIFGKILDGSETVVKAIEKEGTNAGDTGSKIVIVDSGELDVKAEHKLDNGDDPHHNKDLKSSDDEDKEENDHDAEEE